MSIEVGSEIQWRWQGVKSCCWLTSIEMLMGHKYRNIYGRGARTAHSGEAMEAYRRNKGSHISYHSAHYGLAENADLEEGDIDVWKAALRVGPVLAEGDYGWSRLGVGKHVILIAGVSKSGTLAFYNPNAMAVLPHPMSKISYMPLDRCKALACYTHGRPFWQVAEDVRAFQASRTRGMRVQAAAV